MRVRSFITAVALALVGVVHPGRADASPVYFANDPGQWVTFVGDGAGGNATTFTYGSATVTNDELAGFDLTISGVYSLGESINTYTRKVTGGGVLTITDGLGNAVTANIVMSDLFVWGPFQGTNSGLSANLSNILVSASTTNAALLEFVTSASGNAVTTFNITPPYSVNQLAVLNGTLRSSFSGAAVPEPTTLLLLASSVAALERHRRVRKRARVTV